MKDRGIENIEQLAIVSVDELVDAIDVSFDQANEILERAHRLLAQRHAREAREAELALHPPVVADDETETAEGAEAGAPEAAAPESGDAVETSEDAAEQDSEEPEAGALGLAGEAEIEASNEIAPEDSTENAEKVEGEQESNQ